MMRWIQVRPGRACIYITSNEFGFIKKGQGANALAPPQAHSLPCSKFKKMAPARQLGRRDGRMQPWAEES